MGIDVTAGMVVAAVVVVAEGNRGPAVHLVMGPNNNLDNEENNMIIQHPEFTKYDTVKFRIVDFISHK